MATIYVNGTAITENDEVYVNGSALAVGKSVYLNGSKVWTRQADCTTSTSGSTYSIFAQSAVADTGSSYVTKITKTVNSGICSGSGCSMRVGANHTYTSGGQTWGRITVNGTQVVAVQNAANYWVYSSIVNRTINPSDVFALQGYNGQVGATTYIQMQVYTGNNVNIF
jgi:hypothetical protein